MLLAIDIGNSNLHIGLWREGTWEDTWRARTVPKKMGDEYAVLLLSFLQELNIDVQDVNHVVIASVVPILTTAFRNLVMRYLGTEPLIVDHTIDLGIAIDVDLPEQVGADRIINAAAVHHLYGGGPAIVIDFGTATTFDCVRHDGAYIGGAIAPGINLALDALVSHAARLTDIDLVPPPSPIGRTTVQAMQSGLFLGYIGLIEGLVARIRTELAPQQPVSVFATGGLASAFEQQSSVIDWVVDSLTLDGLRVIYDLNRR